MKLMPLVYAIVPLVIAMDPAMAVTAFLAYTEGIEEQVRKRVLRDALVTALVIGVAFIFLQQAVFTVLGITQADFEIGGGAILLVLSLADLVVSGGIRRQADRFIGIVPIGTPLIVGPAVLAALTVLDQTRGTAVTTAAFAATLLITAVAMALSSYIGRAIGTGGLRAASKIVSIFLAAFAIHLIRVGVMDIVLEAERT